MNQPPSVFEDLAAESAELDAIVADLDEDTWRLPTPATGWTIAHQIAHLAWTDQVTLLAVAGPDAFRPVLEQAQADPTGYVDAGAAAGAAGPPDELLAQWRTGRSAVAAALPAVPRGVKLPWYGPPMSAMSMATARLMETWAHGLDIRDTLGLPPTNTRRLRNVAHIAYRARDFNYQLRRLTPPAEQFHLVLTGPDGDTWEWGDAASEQQISGPALDFCLLATQRRHRADLRVSAVGADARKWLTIIQAFAGVPGPGRPAGELSGPTADSTAVRE
ncbi:TIGR03084 family metal-binding protein [Nakamurella lactea]|uniref:TIGR03084 family metal-binding protein n=1 Tax=Nakamurella lactea TaxID=459515 RepID=UPI0003F885B8|nr:TIGR03084 family metal-binding protein [Nakamurella lactea]